VIDFSYQDRYNSAGENIDFTGDQNVNGDFVDIDYITTDDSAKH